MAEKKDEFLVYRQTTLHKPHRKAKANRLLMRIENMEKKRINPVLFGFIAGTEGETQAKIDEEWAKNMAKKYSVDIDTVLLYGKTYGKEAIEKAFGRRKYKGNRHQQEVMRIRNDISQLIEDARKRDDIDQNTWTAITSTCDNLAKCLNALYRLLE